MTSLQEWMRTEVFEEYLKTYPKLSVLFSAEPADLTGAKVVGIIPTHISDTCKHLSFKNIKDNTTTSLSNTHYLGTNIEGSLKFYYSGTLAGGASGPPSPAPAAPTPSPGTGWSKPLPGINSMGYLSRSEGGFCGREPAHGGGTCDTCTQSRNDWNGGQQLCTAKWAKNFSTGHAMFSGQKCGECVLLKCDDSKPDAAKCINSDSFIHIRTDNGFGGDKQDCANANPQINPKLSVKCSDGEGIEPGYNSAELSSSFVTNRWQGQPGQCKMWYKYKKVDCTTGK